MLDRMTQTVRGVVATAFALVVVGLSMPSNAASYRTRFDPLFNFAFSPTLGFKGEAEIDVSNDCVQGANLGSLNVEVGVDCTSADLVSVRLEFYDYALGPGSVYDTILWTQPGSPNFGSVVIDFLSVNSLGKVDGMQLSGPLQGSSTTPEELPFDFDLEFGLAQFDGETRMEGIPTLIISDLQSNSSECPVNALGVSSCKVTARWIPEPASLALVGLALAGLGIARRRVA